MRWIYMSDIPWESLYVIQRPQQVCKALARLGQDVFFVYGRCESDDFSIIDGVKIVGRGYKIDDNEETIFWLNHPGYLTVKEDYNAKLLIFDYVDEAVDEFAFWNNEFFPLCLEQADLVTVVSKRLYEIISDTKPDQPLLYLPNAADIEHFQNAKSLPLPVDLQNLVKPIIGFMGSIAGWIDMQLLSDVIRRTQEMTWVFVGPDYMGINHILVDLDNLHLIDWRLYEVLPAYVGAFDVGIIPFQVRDLTHSSSPVKMYEYIAAGLPVLSTPIAEAVACPYVYTAETADDWINSLNSILYGPAKESVEDRQLYAQNETWVFRMKNLFQFMDQLGISNFDIS